MLTIGKCGYQRLTKASLVDSIALLFQRSGNRQLWPIMVFCAPATVLCCGNKLIDIDYLRFSIGIASTSAYNW